MPSQSPSPWGRPRPALLVFGGAIMVFNGLLGVYSNTDYGFFFVLAASLFLWATLAKISKTSGTRN